MVDNKTLAEVVKGSLEYDLRMIEIVQELGQHVESNDNALLEICQALTTKILEIEKIVTQLTKNMTQLILEDKTHD